MKKFTLLILFCCVCSLSVNALFSQQDRFDVLFENKTITSVLSELKTQTGYVFFYMDGVIPENERVSVDLKNASLEEILDKIFVDKGYDYKIEDNLVIISKSAQQPPQPQQRAVTGRVIDENGDPMVGVSVSLQGTTRGVTTDANGDYLISVPSGSSLIFSHIGYRSQTIAVGSRSTINVKMEVAVEGITEVMVTGIFNKARETYTGAAVTVTEKELQMFRGQNLVQTLKNVDPSINIIFDNNVGSNPNVVPQITIRGNSSLPMSVEEYNTSLRNSVNSPLIIMDGFEISLTKLMDYNDHDIESINILKDASATAIYGSRGANGVIVIISKAPQPGKLKIHVQTDLTVEIPSLTSYDLLNAQEKLDLESLPNVDLYTNIAIRTHLLRKQLYWDLRKGIAEGVDTDWLHYPVHTGVGQKYNVRLEGGSDEFRWGASLLYNNIVGAMKGSERDNLSGTINLAYTFKRVIFKNQLMIGLNKSIESPYGSFSTWANAEPYYTPYNPNGSLIMEFPGMYLGGNSTGNPLYNASLNSIDESKYTEIINNFSIEWSILPELKIRAQFGISKNNNSSDIFVSPSHSRFNTSDYLTPDRHFMKGTYDYSNGESSSWNGALNLSYSKRFDSKHQIYAGLDLSMQEQNERVYDFSLEGFADDDVGSILTARNYSTTILPNGKESKSRRVGITGNMNYTYDNRYYADFSFRVDGSSQFGSNKKYAPFWSVGIGWNIHREAFLENNSVVNNFRVRASYGMTGSQNFEPYQALATYRSYTGDKYLTWDGLELRGLGNPNLTWQSTGQFNTGAEIGLWNNRINATFDYYVKQTSNLLSLRDLPLSMGFASFTDNIGEVQSKGFETSLSAYIIRNTQKELIWMLTGKLARNKDKITKLSEAIKAQTAQYLARNVDVSTLFYEGYSLNSIWAVRSLGIDPLSGEEIFIDRNGNATDVWNPSDKTYCGVKEPLYRGSMNSLLTYKNFILNLSFGFHWGGRLYNQTLLDKVEVTISTISLQNVDRRVWEKRWTTPGDVTFFKGFSNTRTRATSRFVMDDNVFELQSASLQYRLDRADFIKKAGLQALTFGINMSDLFYLSSVKRERGISYPFASRIGGTISLTF